MLLATYVFSLQYALVPLCLKAADMHSTSRVLVCIVQLCFKNKDWNALNEHIVILTKRRSQLKQVEILQYLICSPKFYTVF